MGFGVDDCENGDRLPAEERNIYLLHVHTGSGATFNGQRESFLGVKADGMSS
jgi:hypothetical protein